MARAFLVVIGFQSHRRCTGTRIRSFNGFCPRAPSQITGANTFGHYRAGLRRGTAAKTGRPAGPLTVTHLGVAGSGPPIELGQRAHIDSLDCVPSGHHGGQRRKLSRGKGTRRRALGVWRLPVP